MAIVIATSTLTFSQPKGDYHARPPKPPTEEQLKEMMDQLEAELSLTIDQKEKIYQLHKEHFSSLKKQEEEQQAIHDKMRNDFAASIKSELTKKQMKKFKAFDKKKKRSRLKNKEAEHPRH